jgi:transposase-like protein/IS1 family transposase
MKKSKKQMNPAEQVCSNVHCAISGHVGQGNIVSHGQNPPRYKCKQCGATFTPTKNTALYRSHKPKTEFVQVTTLLAHGCPTQAIVAAFGWDERTVKATLQRTGAHCEAFHERQVLQGALDLQNVQADEIRAKVRGGIVWLAMALMVSSRLWLGGVASTRRDSTLAQRLLQMVRAAALEWGVLLVTTDGWCAYPNAILQAFRSKVAPLVKRRGRWQWVTWPGLMIGQVLKRQHKRRLVEVERRVLRGEDDCVWLQTLATNGGTQLNTSFIERFNATLRQRLAELARRSRQIGQTSQRLERAMYLVGVLYNFCTFHQSLRYRNAEPKANKWSERTPAMASGLTERIWSVGEVLEYKLTPPPAPPFKFERRGRPRKEQSNCVHT